MATDIPAKPTVYRGRHFRSRLEASWAAWFDALNWEWIYEPSIGTGEYQPDFLVVVPPTGARFYVETKPESFADAHEWHDREAFRWREFVGQTWESLLVLIGRPGQWSEGRLDPVNVCRSAFVLEYRDAGTVEVTSYGVWFTGCDRCGEVGIEYLTSNLVCRCLRQRRESMPKAMRQACEAVRNMDWNDRWRARDEVDRHA